MPQLLNRVQIAVSHLIRMVNLGQIAAIVDMFTDLFEPTDQIIADVAACLIEIGQMAVRRYRVDCAK